MSRYKPDPKRCVICGAWFTPNANFKSVCSEECRKVNRKETDRRSNSARRRREWEEAHPGEDYSPRPYKKKTIQKRTLGDTLLTLKAEGKDYVEEQKRATIERYARVII